jgi:uncharacterized protein YxjI
MLDKSKFVVKVQKKGFEIVDPENGQPLATAKEKGGLMATLLGLALGDSRRSITIEVRQKPDAPPLFSVRRNGLLFKKVRVFDGEGKVVGTYKTKKFSLSGGFHIYDKDGKHVAEIKGRMFKDEYKFLAPDRTTEMGSVSKQWRGLTKELFSAGPAYGVEVAPAYAEDTRAKMLILGAALAIKAIFSQKGGKGGGKAEDEAGDEGGDE